MQKILCPKCGSLIEEVKRTSNRQSSTKKSRTICATCKELHIADMVTRNKSSSMRESNRTRMKTDNPMFEAKVRTKMASTLTGTQKSIKEYATLKKDVPRLSMTEISTKMKLNNPMHNVDTVSKMKTTMNRRIEEGIIEYKKGNEHHLWRGNRDFNNTCRTQLYPVWTKKVLERDNFTCTMCQTKNNLQVHHIKPLRSILAEVKKENSINSFSCISSGDWQPLIDEVTQRHKIEEGITVCSACHAIVDDKYKGK